MDVRIDRAAGIGRQHGKNAAGWVFDGNTTDETYRAVLAGIDAGDPQVMDAYNPPNLSGEYSDDYSESQLLADVGFSECAECGHIPGNLADVCECCLGDAETVSGIADAYNDAASAAFWAEVERTARYHLS